MAKILQAADTMRSGIEATEGLELCGQSLFVLAFRSASLNVYRVMDEMATRGWNLNGLHRPAAVHICVTLRHAQPGVAKRFVRDLGAAAEAARRAPLADEGLAPVYGLAGTLPARGLVGELLKRYLDRLYRL